MLINMLPRRLIRHCHKSLYTSIHRYNSTQRTLVCGIDEAGRGAIVGPLVVSLCALTQTQYNTLKTDTTIRDSKLTTSLQRKTIYNNINALNIQYNSILYSAQNIDKLRTQVDRLTINAIELQMCIECIESFSQLNAIHTVYVDSFTSDTVQLQQYLTTHFNNEIQFIVEHKADNKYLPVSIASIIAKIKRDDAVVQIQHELYSTSDTVQQIGSGYPADVKTQQWLSTVLQKPTEHEREMSYIRHTWKRGSWAKHLSTLTVPAPPRKLGTWNSVTPDQQHNLPKNWQYMTQQHSQQQSITDKQRYQQSIQQVATRTYSTLCRHTLYRTPHRMYHTTRPNKYTTDDFVMIEQVDKITDLTKPVILRGAANDWKLKSMSWNELSALESETVVPCEISMNGGDYRDLYDEDRNNNTIDSDKQRHFQHEIGFEWKQLIEYIQQEQQQSSNTKVYLAQQDIFNDCTNLGALVSKTLPIQLSDKLQTPTEAELQRRIWLGPRGTVSPLHCDIYNNVYVQLKGSKLITLFKPDQTDLVKPYRNNYFLRNTSTLNNIDHIREQGITIGLQAGDILYMPKMYWHYIESLSSSLSISYWWR